MLYHFEICDYDSTQFIASLAGPDGADLDGLKEKFFREYGIKRIEPPPPFRKGIFRRALRYARYVRETMRKLVADGFDASMWGMPLNPVMIRRTDDWAPAFVWWLKVKCGWVEWETTRYNMNEFGRYAEDEEKPASATTVC